MKKLTPIFFLLSSSVCTVALADLFRPGLTAEPPGGVVSEQFDKLQDESESIDEQKAVESGNSYIPTIKTLQPVEDGDANDKDTNKNKNASASNKTAKSGKSGNANTGVYTEDEAKRINANANAMQGFFSAKSKITYEAHQAVSTGFTMPKVEPVKNDANDTGAADDKITIAPGNRFLAAIELQLVSDEPGPVFGRILNGQLKGATILGKFQISKNEEAVTLVFDQLSLGENTIGINAVALDPSTGRIGLADDVDHHYFSRYGAIVLSSMLKGMGEATKANGTKVVASDFNVQAESNFDTQDQIKIALGEVGASLADAAKENFKTPNTITLEFGKPIGILILSPISASWIPEKDARISKIVEKGLSQ